ncbi:MAG: biotin--[acetyl-CoA-carboxylase] ligase [Crocinitomicaceae bacterium]|nr:biotin--[acetyl-CoA-carboxylase] ligase [Crocinitomicaceae bacterium]
MQIGRKLIHLESVDSTNNYTANVVKSQGLSSGTVILADEQFAGRGQRGAEWVVEPGMNLTFSVYLEVVNLSVENQFDLSKVVVLSICHFLKKVGIDAQVKWPNDILVQGNKISGVLIENTISSSGPIKSIVGVGINVNQTRFGEFNATSIQSELGTFYPIRDALFSFIESFNLISDELLDRPSVLHDRYLDKLFQYKTKNTYEDASGVFEGEICGIEQSGKLIVQKDNQEVSYDLKEIKFL